MNSEQLTKTFEKAVNYVQMGLAKEQFPNVEEISDDNKLTFYGLYKVATIGPNNTTQPGFFDFVGKAKWNAWTNKSKLTKYQAMEEYINLLNKLASNWEKYYDEYF